jgi:hypothetical protein
MVSIIERFFASVECGALEVSSRELARDWV